MSFDNIQQSASKYFPDFKVKFKNENLFMKILGKLLFFNKDFMNIQASTIGSTIYFPSQSFVKIRPITASMILLHELVHIHDNTRITKPVFNLLYLLPQLLSLISIPIFFTLGPLFALPFLLFLAPLPAYFRMYYEKRAYIASLYCLHTLSNRLTFPSGLDAQTQYFITQFKNSNYYFMWPFSNIDKDFNEALVKIRNGERPYEDEVFDILDELIKAA